jgi:hypothetical protein
MLPRFVSSLSDSDAIDLFSPQRQFLECEILSYEPVFRLHSCLISHSKSRLESRHQHRCMHSILGVCKHQAFQPNLPTKHRFGYCKKRKRNLRSDSEARQITPTSQHGPKSRSRNGPLFVVATSNPNRKKNNLSSEKLTRNRILTSLAPAPRPSPNRRSTRAARGGGRRVVEVETGGSSSQQQYPTERSKRRQEILPGAGAADV